MKKLVTGLLLGLCCWAAATVSHATKYALCTGLNKYKTSYISSDRFLNGCVPDAKNVYTNITLRGEWQKANATILTDSQGTFAAVSNKLMSLAQTAVSGDVVLYYHSSHGYQDSGKNTGICMYDKDMPDSSFAKILANFKADVKVVIVLDTCHSGGMFKSIRRDGTTRALDTASPFAFAQRVNEELAAIRADEAARGIKAAKLAVLDCAWITAADYNQYSWDGDEGGAFTDCFIGSVKSGACDESPYGNGDSYATFMEMFDYAVAQDDTHGDGNPGSEDYTMPQCTNTTVLKAVTFGWVGKEEPSGIRFAPIPEQTATVGAPISCTLVASNVDGSTGTITFSVASSTAPKSSYSLSGADFTFTAPADGDYSFSFLATNATAHTYGKANMTVSATLAAPAGLDNSGITATSFTANWDATPGAASYLLDVASEAFSAPKAAEDAILSEDFSAFTGTSAERSGNLDEYLSGTGWTGSKVFENEGSAKLGSSSYNGWIATPEFDLSAGGTVSFLLTQYKTDANTVTVSILSGGDETDIGTVTPGAAETVEFAIPAASAATSVKIATSAKRAIIDDLVVTSGGGADVLANQPVDGTSFTVEGLETSTYYWRVRAVGNAKGPFSDTEEVTLKSDPTAPPSIRKIDDIEIEVGETAIAQVKVSAPDEAPVTSLSITAGDDAATLEDGVFSFAPAAPGTYDFTITAVNANDSTTVSFAVIASLADPETPVAPAEEVASDSFTAEWEAVPGAVSYELLVIEGQGGSGGGGGSGGSGETLTETFANATFSTAGGSYASQTISGGDLGTWTATQCRGDQGGVPTVGGTGTLTSPEIANGVSAVEFDYSWPFGETATGDIDLYVGGAKVSSASVTGGTAGTAAYSFSPVSGATSIEFVNAHATAKKLRISFNEIRITTASAKSIARAVGDVVFSNNVGNVTSYEVTGLLPSTEYTFAFRAIAGDEATEWSAPATVKTSDGPSAPAWSAIPAQRTYAGATFQLDLSPYLSGSPVPTVTADAGTVSGLHFVFEPEATGTVTVTLTAVNDSGTDETTFVLEVAEAPVGGTHYAVLVGCNKYDTDYVGSDNFLTGCVPDANHLYALITTRGDWEAENVTKLTDSAAKHAAIRAAIAKAAAAAVPGDTFLYTHSSHGGNYAYHFDDSSSVYTDYPVIVYDVDPEGEDNCICAYDADYTAAELAEDLAAFDPGVNVVVFLDTCHSAGMFKYDASPDNGHAVPRNAAGKPLRSASPALFAGAVSDRVGAIRRARGIRTASNIGFVTAANFDEYSLDSVSGEGGEFTTAFVEGVTNGVCDSAEYGDQDGWATFYEGWNYAKDIAVGADPGEEVDYNVFVDENGYALYDNSYYAEAYDEPEYYYDYYFTHPQITNEAVLRAVRVGYAGTPTLDAPVAAPASGLTASSFTASWSAVDEAIGYRLQVATDPSFSTGAVADTLTADDFEATSNNYTSFSGVDKDSDAVYAGKTAKHESGAIQLNNKAETGSGIWTTDSGGIVSRVAVEWNDATTTSKPRSLQIYGSDTALTSYSAVKSATLVGTIVYGTDTALDIDGSYAYVGILADGGALYLDSVEIGWGVAGSGSSIVLDQDVGNVTSFEVAGLEAETDYWYRVQALGERADSDFSNVIALTTEAGTPYAPVWSEIPEQTAIAGDLFDFDASAYVKASPAATITLVSCDADEDDYVFGDGLLLFTPPAEGSYEFEFQAANDLGASNSTVTVTALGAPVTVPELTLSNPSPRSFDAAWTACTGVSSYTLQVATDDQFTADSAGGEVELFNNPGNPANLPDDWSYDVASGTSKYLQLTDPDQSVISAEVSTEGFTTLTVSFEVRTFNGVSGASGTALVECSTDGSTWTEVGSVVATANSMSKKTIDAAVAIGQEAVRFRWTAPYADAEGGKGIGIQNLALSGAASAGDGSLVKELAVEGTSATVDGLEPETTYYARVKGAAEWSEVESITTEAEEPAPPTWSDIPEQTATVGRKFSIDLAPYVTGTPFPAITVDGEPAEDGKWSFTPDEAGTLTFELVATNSEGSDTATLTVVVSEESSTVPVLTLSNATSSSFDAAWTACAGATAYQFQVATSSDFKAARAGDAILSEDFAKCAKANGSDISSKLDDYTETDGWTGVKVFEDDGRIKLGSSSAIGSLVTPAVDIPAGASLSFKIAKYGTDTGTVDVQLSADGGAFESLLDSPIAPVADGQTYEVEFDEAVASAQIKFVTSAKRAYLDDVVLSGEGGGGSGSGIVVDETLAALSFTVEGLEPDTLYFARVRATDGEWSEVAFIRTDREVPEGPAKYALCIGVNEYDGEAWEEAGYPEALESLKGPVNDATNLRDNLVGRGGWARSNTTLLTDAAATKAAIRAAFASYAAKAEPGDTFVYQHSSHGDGDDDDGYLLCAYDGEYTDDDLAEDLSAFQSGVKIVVLIDACRSAGMTMRDARAEPKPFAIAERVSALMDARRAARRARGEDVSRAIDPAEIGWVTAAAADEDSRDGGFYDTDEWIYDDEAEGVEYGGFFLASFTLGWWSGKADLTGVGDGDGWFDAYEGWSFASPVCIEGGHHPQFLHEDVLRSVELGWSGTEMPSDDILFDPVPGVTVGIGEQAVLEGIAAHNADGTDDGIELSIVATDPEGLEYAFADGRLTFTPAADGTFLFTLQADNGTATATKLLGVTAVLDAPVALPATDVSDTGFTANWKGVDAAEYYQLQVSTSPDFPEMEPEKLIEEGFDDVTTRDTLPEGWEFAGTFDTYTSDASSGEEPPSIKFSKDGDTLMTPEFELNRLGGLTFWVKGNGSGTNMSADLKVEMLVGTEWEELDSFEPSTAADGETKEYDELDPDATRIRFVMVKPELAVGNIALDDVMIATLGDDAKTILDEDEIEADATSFEVEDLQPGTTYYYRVRALANTKSAWSETIEVTTAGEKPIPVPDLTIMAPETSADTSLAAFWVCTGAAQFRLQVATDEAFASLVFDETMTEIAKTVTGLTPETTYYVRVCALDGERVGDWSNVENITTAASGGDVPVQADIEAVTIDGTARTMKFAVPADATVMTTTNLVTGPWVAYEGNVDGEGNVVIPLTGTAAFFRLGEPPASE